MDVGSLHRPWNLRAIGSEDFRVLITLGMFYLGIWLPGPTDSSFPKRKVQKRDAQNHSNQGQPLSDLYLFITRKKKCFPLLKAIFKEAPNINSNTCCSKYSSITFF